MNFIENFNQVARMIPATDGCWKNFNKSAPLIPTFDECWQKLNESAIGDKDFLKPYGEELLKSFVDPVVIRHPMGHTVPRLDKEGIKAINSFLDRVEESITKKADNAINYLNSAEQSEKIELEEESH